MTDWVHRPDDTRVFVFGSNVAGVHGAGAALYAYEQLGADWGRGIGMSANGRSYALPTKDRWLYTLPLVVVDRHVREFLAYASSVPDTRFFVSEVGCGLAGYRPEHIAPLFWLAPVNCDLPPGWRV